MVGIYIITSPIGKVYIGQSIDIEKRFSYYYRLACKSQPKLYNSLIEHGVKKHLYEVLEECELKDLNDKERFYQEKYKANKNGNLNSRLTSSRDRSGEFSEEHKLKLSLAKKGIKTFRPSTHTVQSKNKLRIFNLGKVRSKEAIEKTRLKNTGKKRTEEQKERISNAKKGKLNPMYGMKIKESSKELQRKKISGVDNYLSKLILNTETGIFYYGLREAAESIGMKKATLHVNITKNLINKTSFIYV